MNASSDKSCCWSITINNPTDQDKIDWANLSGLSWVREVSGQMEEGQEGTPHIQGMVKTASVRFSQVKKALPRAHIEAAKSPAALAKYVTKTETRVASIPTVKIATQADVQRVSLAVALNYCYQYDKNQDPLSTDELQMLIRWSYELRRDWEKIVDESVRSLILGGFYGVEFVMANPQVRTAFRKYLPEILYRTYNAHVTSQPPPLQPQDQEGTLETPPS